MMCTKFKRRCCFAAGCILLVLCTTLVLLDRNRNHSTTHEEEVSMDSIQIESSSEGELRQTPSCNTLPLTANAQALVNAIDRIRPSLPGVVRVSSPRFDTDQAFGAWVDILSAIVPSIVQYESPIQARITSAIDSFTWNCIATFSPGYKESVSRQTPTFFEYRDAEDEDLLGLRFECFATGIPVIASYLLATPPVTLDATLRTLGYDGPTLLKYDAAAETHIEAQLGMHQEDALRALYPIGALVAYDYIIHALRDDGWNQDGRASCAQNCIPYSDPGIEVTGMPSYTVDRTSNTSWRPLREHDSRGFVFYGDHITPHIGLVAKFKVASPEVQAQTTPAPDYAYSTEIPLLLERMRRLNDTSKLLIELFDDKLRLAFVVLGNLLATYPQLTWEDAINFFLGFTAVEHDAILLTWREKRRHDLVRPPTLIRRLGPAQILDTYPTALKSTEFEPYIRTMPHSEFPSGSASICNTIQNYTDGWLIARGLSPLSIALSFPPGSSLKEPGSTPNTTLDIRFDSMTQLAAACRQSRLDAGLHFTAAVNQLGSHCQGLGSEGVRYVQNLLY